MARLLYLAAALAGLAAQRAVSFELAASHPTDGADNVALDASISLRFSEPVDPDSLPMLKLVKADADPQSDARVPVSPSTDLTGASITLTPDAALEPRTRYGITGGPEILSKSGDALTPFSLRFTTGDSPGRDPRDGLVFEPVVFDRSRSTTCIALGPDRRLYAADAFGHLVRWEIEPDSGAPHGRAVLLDDPQESRQYIDLEWDPDATAERLVLWASFAERLAPKDERHYFTGTIARITIAPDGTIAEETIVTGLPHGREKQGGFDTLPHQPNGLVFKDGILYQSVGSTSSSGGPANWGLPEQPLSACILAIDYRRIDDPLDLHPAAGFDPADPDSPVQIFATGVRNALEIVAHSNGRLYTAVNINDRAGPGDGVPDHPDIPGDQNTLVRTTTPDHESLFILEEGRHYGFPNPARGEFVLAGGNPTAGPDPFEIPDYPVGTQPDPGFAPHLMCPLWKDGGTSPDGLIEYLPKFPHPLSHSLICCFFSARSIAALPLSQNGLPSAVLKLRPPLEIPNLHLTGPLDLTLNPDTGSLYIANFGTQSTFGADGSLVALHPKRH